MKRLQTILLRACIPTGASRYQLQVLRARIESYSDDVREILVLADCDLAEEWMRFSLTVKNAWVRVDEARVDQFVAWVRENEV